MFVYSAEYDGYMSHTPEIDLNGAPNETVQIRTHVGLFTISADGSVWLCDVTTGTDIHVR